MSPRLACCALILSLTACSTRSTGVPGSDSGPMSRVDTGPPVVTTCTGGGGRCTGNVFERCVEGRWTLEQACLAGTPCSDSTGCASPDACALAQLQRSNFGCEYFAADLPQPRASSLFIPAGNPWRAPYGVAISNPNDSEAVIRIEKNDAAPGEPEAISIVMEMPLAANTVRLFPLPAREVNGVTADTGPASRSVVSNRAYRITSTLPIVAYQFNPVANSGVFSDDASLLVPSHALDESYVALGWPGQGAIGGTPTMPSIFDNRSFLTIVATQPDTRVRLIPSTPVQPGDGVPALVSGQAFEVRLDRFGVLNVQGADVATAGPTDFTGSRIEADKPVVVFSGVEAINISEPNQSRCCADHLEEQLIPRSSLGKDYVVVRSRPRRPTRVGPPEPDYFKVLAISDGTMVTTSLDGADSSFTLSRGQARLMLSDRSFTLTATQPVVIGQFLLSGAAVHPEVVDPFTREVTDPGEQIGDPSFLSVPPVAQFRADYRFLVPSGYERNYALIAAPTGTEIRTDSGTLDCTRAAIGELGGVSYEQLHCALTEGGQHLRADAPFSVLVEGWGPGVVSYGYTAGQDFERINTDCTVDDECPGGEFCSGGYCVEQIDLL